MAFLCVCNGCPTGTLLLCVSLQPRAVGDRPLREVGADVGVEAAGLGAEIAEDGIDAEIIGDVKDGVELELGLVLTETELFKALKVVDTLISSPPESDGKDSLAVSGGWLSTSFAVLGSSAGGGQPPGLVSKDSE